MSEYIPEGYSFTELLSGITDPDLIRQQVGELLTDKEHQYFGEDASDRVSDALAVLGVFAPNASFDISSFKYVAEISEDDAQWVLDFSVRVGITNKQDGRYLLSAPASQLLANLLTDSPKDD